MLARIALALIAALSIALFATLSIEQSRVARERSSAAAAALEASNLAATHDTTSDLAAGDRRIAKILGDSLRLVGKRALQVTQHADALDRALGMERRARFAMQATVDSLHAATASVAAVVASGADSQAFRSASFALRQEPYTVNAFVRIPPPPDSARMTVHVALDPIPVVARVSCSPPNNHGIRSATIVASSPRWARVRFDSVEQSPELCDSPALPRAGAKGPAVEFKRLMVGGGALVGPNGRWSWGGFVGAGFVARGFHL